MAKTENTVVVVQRRGIITIPEAVRKALGIQEGDIVRLTVEKVENPENKRKKDGTKNGTNI